MEDFTRCGGTEVVNLTCIPILLGNLLFWLLGLVGLVAVIFVIYGGAKFILSGGDPKQVEGARKTITYALIGLAVVIMAAVIVNLIGTITGAKCFQIGTRWSLGSCQVKINLN
jgi:hypothetical protein